MPEQGGRKLVFRTEFTYNKKTNCNNNARINFAKEHKVLKSTHSFLILWGNSQFFERIQPKQHCLP